MLIVTLALCVMALGLLILVLGYLNPTALALITSFLQDVNSPHSIQSRGELWSQSLQDLTDHPLIGTGAGQTLEMPNSLLPNVSHSHNVVIDYARTLGVPGLILITFQILIILAVCASTTLKALNATTSRWNDRILAVGLSFGPVAYVGANFSSDSFGPTTSPFLFSVLYLMLANRRFLWELEVVGKVFQFGPLTLNYESRSAKIHETELALGSEEYQLLEELSKRPGIATSYDKIMDSVFENHVYIDEDTMDQLATNLTKSIRSVDPNFDSIEKVSGLGYRLRNG